MILDHVYYCNSLIVVGRVSQCTTYDRVYVMYPTNIVSCHPEKESGEAASIFELYAALQHYSK